jgi:protein-L-isoaspartate(D-aspartate) O-methyltransferase
MAARSGQARRFDIKRSAQRVAVRSGWCTLAAPAASPPGATIAEQTRMMNLEPARQAMISQQIRTCEVSDRAVLDCLARVPREHFVPDEFMTLAFSDVEIPLGHGYKMLRPVVEGRLLQALNLNPEHRVLLIGTGSGFTTACVARLADHVTAVEIFADLHEYARDRLTDARVHNVDLQHADFNELNPGHGFDRILLTGSMPRFDARMAEWLEPEGQCIMVTGTAPAMRVERISRTGERYRRETLFETVVPPLLNVPAAERFTF